MHNLKQTYNYTLKTVV